ncbi:hypothetical protein [Bauldia sp.]|uniref:hypothetical protein n=1 Tax=Bauldia sp. TaxID=2575872 RepID=UPI003BA861C6
MATKPTDLGDKLWDRAVVRAVVTPIVFVVLGPVFCLGYILLYIGLQIIFAQGEDWPLLIPLAMIFPIALWPALLIGALPAGIAGIFFAVLDFGRRRSSFWLAVVVGAVAGFTWWRFLGATVDDWTVDGWSIGNPATFLGCIGATVTCWYSCLPRTRREMT